MPGPFGSVVAGAIRWRPPIVVGSGGTQTISVTGVIPSQQNWFTPVVAGPVNPILIPSAEHWFSPFINLKQTITPTLIASGETWFSPSVDLVTAIFPTLIPSGETWFTPKIEGATQYINLGALIRSGESWPIPAVQGGNPSLKIYIGGVDRTATVNGLSDFSPMGAGSNASAATITSQTIGRATLTFDLTNLDGATYTPTLGQTVKVTEGAFILFAGCLDAIAADLEEGSTKAIVYHCTALDKSSICDHRVVKQVTYTGGLPYFAVIQDIVVNYLMGEGITMGGVPFGMGTLSADLPFNYDTVTTAFNRIATLSGTIWWIDFFGVLNFSSFDNLPAAPWNINLTNSADIRKLVVTQTLSGEGATSGYRNKQYSVSNINILPGGGGGGTGGQQGVTETFTWTNGSTGVLSQYISGVLTPVQIQVSLALGSIQSITVNGNIQTVVEYSQFTGQTSTGPNDFLWFYTSNQSGVVGAQANITTPTFGPLPAGATVVIQYVPGGTTNAAAAQVGSALVPTDPFGSTFGTCGSGIYEAVQQVQNISTQVDLDTIAQAILDRSGGIPTIITFETDKPGLFVGQAIDCFLPVLDLPATGGTPVSMLITSISGTAQTGPLAYGSWFRWSVTAVSNRDPGNWITYFSNLIARSNNPLPVPQYDVKTFIISPGSNVAAGTINTNPVYVDQTGLLIALYAGAGVAPLDQDLVVTFKDVTLNITLGSVTIPAGSTSQVVTTIPSSLQIYLYALDQITVTTHYNQTGGSPSAAQSVTAAFRTQR